MKLNGKPLLILIGLNSCLALAGCGEPSTLVSVAPYTDGIQPVLAAGEHWVDFSVSRSTLFGRETSRDLVCLACAGDPAVTGFRMQLFRMDPDGLNLVAHTNEVPAPGPIMFEYDIEEVEVGTQYLLRVTFQRPDTPDEVCEKTAQSTPSGI